MCKDGNLTVIFRAQRIKSLLPLDQNLPVAENDDKKVAKWSLKHICRKPASSSADT